MIIDPGWLKTPERRFAAFAGALLLARIVAIVIGHPQLGPDEGQYWFWSKAPAFGYYSKPPLIAWSIAATTALFGEAEWAVRLSAPLYQLGAAIFLFLLARRLKDAHAAFWAGAAWLTLPGVFLSSTLMTTDAPLMFFCSAGLYYFFLATDAREKARRRRWAILLGAAIGLGFLAKYAMSYFVIGAALALAVSPARRRAFGLDGAALTLLVAAALIAPNIFWNAQHDFQTLSHTAANADWGRGGGRPGELLKYLGDQLAIAGPLLFPLIAFAAFMQLKSPSERREDAMRALILFAAPAIAIVAFQALISRAHGNWAAAAYPPAILMTSLWAIEKRRAAAFLKANIALHLLIGAGFLLAFADLRAARGFGAEAAFKRLKGWEEIGARIEEASIGYDAIMTDDREVTGELVYYARDGAPIVAWDSNNRIDSHFEAFNAFDATRDRRVLYVTERADALYIKNRFGTIEPIGAVAAPVSAKRMRTLYLFEVRDFAGA